MDPRRPGLDFPVLMLDPAPADVFVSGIGIASVVGLCTVEVGYGDAADRLRLVTTARRGWRMGPHGPHRQPEDVASLAGAAVSNLLLSTISPGMPGEPVRQQVERAVDTGKDREQAFPGAPWRVREVPVDGVPFALWSCTLPEGFAAALDLGPAVLTAWGYDFDEWDWRLTAAALAVVRPLIDAFDEDDR